MTPSPSPPSNGGNTSQKKVVGTVVGVVTFLAALVAILQWIIPIFKENYCKIAAHSPLPVRDDCWKKGENQQSQSKNYQILTGHRAKAYAAAFSPNHKSTTLPEETELVYSIALNQTLGKHKDEVYSLAFSPDGKILVSGSADGTIKLWDPSRKKEKEKSNWTAHNRVVGEMAFSPDGKILVSASGDGTIKFWDAKKLETEERYIGELNHEGSVMSVAFLPKGCEQRQILASAGESGIIELWDADTRQRIKTLPGHKKDAGHSRVWSVAFSPDCKTLASGGHDSSVKIWDWKAETQKLLDPTDNGPVCMVAFSPDGKTLVSNGCHDKAMYVFDVDSPVSNPEPSRMVHYCQANSDNDFDRCKKYSCLNEENEEKKICGVYAIAISQNGILASGGYDSNIKIWNLRDQKEIATYEEAHRGTVRSLIFSPDGNSLVSGGGNPHNRGFQDTFIEIWRPY